jgi:hypothetical protein
MVGTDQACHLGDDADRLVGLGFAFRKSPRKVLFA